ncbi:hypothetical protein [Solibacillus sp. CAU 1738]|uniref:hypothetical protein n=1 Tax=Solibacillus sp. CAU 1738 TaxID=3140363 RepID=UPI0032614DD1
MTDYYQTIVFSSLGLVATVFLIIYFIKKQRNHKDFWIVITGFSIFGLLCFSLVIGYLLDLPELLKGDFKTENGVCEIVDLGSGGRFGSDNGLQISVNNVTVSASRDDFEWLEEGKENCTIKYLNTTDQLIEIEID